MLEGIRNFFQPTSTHRSFEPWWDSLTPETQQMCTTWEQWQQEARGCTEYAQRDKAIRRMMEGLCNHNFTLDLSGLDLTSIPHHLPSCLLPEIRTS